MGFANCRLALGEAMRTSWHFQNGLKLGPKVSRQFNMLAEPQHVQITGRFQSAVGSIGDSTAGGTRILRKTGSVKSCFSRKLVIVVLSSDRP